ncbi:MAG: F0F1 ATP synthase subunit A [Ferruginibacter sp.]|nr:F0F1 ATP synthase subunit A [Cytophagales bacterium]
MRRLPIWFFFFTILLVPRLSLAEEKPAGGKFDISGMIMHHVSDAHMWHFFNLGHHAYGIHLPVILYSADRGLEVFSSKNFYGDSEHPEQSYQGYRIDEHEHVVPTEAGRQVYDFSITKNVASLLLSVVLMFVVFFSVASAYRRNRGKAPSGIQSLFEPVIVFVRDDIAKANIGPKYERYLPYLLTIFFFIWFNNLLGLTPGSANLSGNIAVTGVLALATFLVTQFSGNRHYWQHIFATPGVPKALLPIMVPVEIIGVFTKPFSLMVRLFANITAGHIIILSLLGIIFLFESLYVSPLVVVFSLFMNFVELLVATLQAYIFTLFSAMYIGNAVVEDHHPEDDREHSLG